VVDELEMIWKKAVIACFKLLFQHLHKLTKKMYKELRNVRLKN
jgi:hypothetical protein